MAAPQKMVALAVVAHPDDIEFYFAGTLLLLKQAGCEIHMWNLANGDCGSMEVGREEIARTRAGEAKDAAAIAGAQIHAPLFTDLDIFYDRESLRKVGAVLRKIRPQIVLTHALPDYMEDHMNAARLVVTSALGHTIPNYKTSPEVAHYDEPVRVYHAAPHGLRDPMERPFAPHFLVDTSSVLETKKQMLAAHKSQRDWLMRTQGMDAYVNEMVKFSGEIASLGRNLVHAEGWTRHFYPGFCPADFDPLPQLLKSHVQTLKS